MSDQLKKELKERKEELKQINSGEPSLQKLAGDVDDVLNETGDVSKALVHSLQQTAEEFEARHPQLTAAINNVMTSLSNLGI